MTEYDNNTDLLDKELPGLLNDKFNKKVQKQFIKETKPMVKPKEVFNEFKETKKTPTIKKSIVKRNIKK